MADEDLKTDITSNDARSDILAALEQHGEPSIDPKQVVDEPAPKGVKQAKITGRDEQQPKAKAKAKDPDPKPEEETEEEKPEGDAVVEETTEEDGEKKEAKGLEPPQNWSQADKERFKEIPEPAQKFVLDRHKAMEADYTRKTTEIAEFKKEYGAIDEMFSPYKSQMRGNGWSPFQVVQAWMNAERALMDPGQREGVIRQIAQAYNIDLGRVAGVQAGAKAQLSPEDQQAEELRAILNPILEPYQKQIEALRGQVGQQQQFATSTVQQNQQAQYQRVQNDIEAFANVKDDKGQLAHPYFRDVENDMAMLATGFRSMNQQIPSLEELYQRAVYANPSTRERLESAQRNAAALKATEEAKDKAARARKAGSSVTGAPRTSGQFRGNGKASDDIRSLLESAAEDAFSQ